MHGQGLPAGSSKVGDSVPCELNVNVQHAVHLVWRSLCHADLVTVSHVSWRVGDNVPRALAIDCVPARCNDDGTAHALAAPQAPQQTACRVS